MESQNLSHGARTFPGAIAKELSSGKQGMLPSRKVLLAIDKKQLMKVPSSQSAISPNVPCSKRIVSFDFSYAAVDDTLYLSCVNVLAFGSASRASFLLILFSV